MGGQKFLADFPSWSERSRRNGIVFMKAEGYDIDNAGMSAFLVCRICSKTLLVKNLVTWSVVEDERRLIKIYVLGGRFESVRVAVAMITGAESDNPERS